MKRLAGAELHEVTRTSTEGLSADDLLSLAQKGNPAAQLEIGRKTLYPRDGGDIEKNDFSRNNFTARRCFDLVAEQTIDRVARAHARYELARMNMLGLGGGPGENFVRTETGFAKKPDKPEHHLKVVTDLLAAVQEKVPPAIHMLGEMTWTGYQWPDATGHAQGIRPDHTKAALHFNAAAVLGYHEAQYRMAKLYETGDKNAGIRKSQHHAFEHYMAAADQWHPGAVVRIARCYEYGQLGQEKNPAIAYGLYKILTDNAASLAHDPPAPVRKAYAEAFYHLGMMLEEGVPGVTHSNPDQAIDMYSKSISMTCSLKWADQNAVEKMQYSDRDLRYAGLIEKGHGQKWGLGDDVAESYYARIVRRTDAADPIHHEASRRMTALEEKARASSNLSEDEGYLCAKSLDPASSNKKTPKNVILFESATKMRAVPKDFIKVDPDTFVPPGLAASLRLG